jgi:hypothetical protein
MYVFCHWDEGDINGRLQTADGGPRLAYSRLYACNDVFE